VLIIGGGDGLALREVLKYSTVRKVTLVDMDPTITNLAATHPILTQINRSAMTNPKVEIINTDGAKFIRKTEEFYGVIIVDLPDPDSVDLMHVYSKEFYAVLGRHLIRGGILTTQATSPYFSRKAFLCILKTVEAAGFSVLPYHNQIPTMGEWGWVLGVGNQEADFAELKQLAIKLDFSDMETRFISRDAMISMIHFGKGIFNESDMKEIQINTEINPVLYTYYADGTWGMY
jgi:spermidine synthase